MNMPPFQLWIEAEVWTPGDWNPADANSDVMVTLADGSQWVATFYTYANVMTLAAKNTQTGECLNGTYFWDTDMILVSEVSRAQIERVVAHVLEEGYFERAFTLVEPDNEATTAPQM